MTKLLYKDEVYAVVGAAMDVYNNLRYGFLEAVYQEALEMELRARGILFKRQAELHVAYKGQVLRKTYVADFLIYDALVVEIKAIERLSRVDEAQLLNYLRATGYHVGLLVNFGGSEGLEWRRKVMTT